MSGLIQVDSIEGRDKNWRDPNISKPDDHGLIFGKQEGNSTADSIHSLFRQTRYLVSIIEGVPDGKVSIKESVESWIGLKYLRDHQAKK